MSNDNEAAGASPIVKMPPQQQQPVRVVTPDDGADPIKTAAEIPDEMTSPDSAKGPISRESEKAAD